MQSLASNVTNASPISDLNPILLASGATLNFASVGNMPVIITVIILLLLFLMFVDGERAIRMDNDFFTEYRTTTMKPNEILKSVIVPLTRKVFILCIVLRHASFSFRVNTLCFLSIQGGERMTLLLSTRASLFTSLMT